MEAHFNTESDGTDGNDAKSDETDTCIVPVPLSLCPSLSLSLSVLSFTRSYAAEQVLATVGDSQDRLSVLFQDGLTQQIPLEWVVCPRETETETETETERGRRRQKQADEDCGSDAGDERAAEAERKALTAQLVETATRLDAMYRQKEQALHGRRREIDALGERVRTALTKMTQQAKHANAKAARNARDQASRILADADADASRKAAAAKQAIRSAKLQAEEEAKQIVAAARDQANLIVVEAEQEAARIAEERAAWEEEKATIAETQSFSGGKVVLDVGGTKFATRLSTLQAGEAEGSMLGAMFSGRHPLEKDEDGSYFIDRDGRTFHHVRTLFNATLKMQKTTAEN